MKRENVIFPNDFTCKNVKNMVKKKH